ncbi:MAG: domain S-box/diguanylate cyclase domain protein [Francisellaceae bacterium]|nr:domain S-box/diguanylate cyclase domain protein [Francisellaceae bacterium]
MINTNNSIIPLISRFVIEISLAISNIQLKDALQLQTFKDPLTSLSNRRYLEETLVKDISVAKRMHSPLSLLMIDIDHFKRFNDEFGHEVGDIVLKEVAKLFQKNIRNSDNVYRLGGEEFLIVLPDATQEEAFEKAENIRVQISEQVITYQDITIPPVTISIGISTYPIHADTQEALLATADKALLMAKAQGRNQSLIFNRKK